MKLATPIALALSLALLGVGCSRSDDPTASGKPEASDQSASEAVILGPNQGRVISSIQVPGYTYIEAETQTGNVWLAGPPIEVEAGELLSWGQASPMTNFTSKSLNRTFDQVLFVAGYQKDSGNAAAQPEQSSPSGSAPGASQATVISAQTIAGYTYLETEAADGSQLWIAVPTTEVSAGQKVSWSGGSMMYDFHSQSLDKTFPQILFAGGVQVVE